MKYIYIYILRSINFPVKTYIGITSDIKRRLREHNQGKCKHTSKYRPWRVEVYVVFRNKMDGIRFEKYLKSGSGRSFIKRHLVQSH